MKRILLKAVLTVGLISLIFHSVGCLKQNPSNSSENEVKFSTYSQQERQQYIRKYLYETYGLKCSVSDVSLTQLGIFNTSDYYYAIAETENHESVSLWISPNGQISDTVFYLKLQETVYSYYKSILDKELSNYQLKVYSEFRGKPSKTWNENEDIVELLSQEPVYSYLRVYIDDTVISNENIIDEVCQQLDICDATVFIYQCDGISKNDIDSIDLSTFSYKKDIKRRI